MRELAEEFKDLFQGTIGLVNDPNFIVRASIDEESSTLSTNKCKNYYESLSPSVKQAILDKFRRELSQGVLVPCSTLKIIPRNILPIFAVPKKTAKGRNILLDASKVRLIADCS